MNLRKLIYFFALLIFLIFSCIFGVSVGVMGIGLLDVLNAFLGTTDPLTETIVINIRFARVLLSVGTGIALGCSGAAVQSVFQNPLAEPYILGISAGSVLGVIVSLVFFPGISYGTQVFSFLFAILTILIVYRISGIGGTVQPSTLVLAGIAITAFFSAITSYLIYAHFSKNIATILFWTMGGFWHADLFAGSIVLAVSLICMLVLLCFWRELNALSLGDNFAMNVGIDVGKTRQTIIILVAFCVSFAVSFTGIIGFVGLIVPHIARFVVGAEHRKLIVFSGLTGGVLLLWADTASRTLVYGEEIPVGIITAILGVPFFLYLLIRRRKIC
ncbi:MAG: FecCD family ABC transporter permease [Thermoplasmata archaeon]